MSLCAVRRFRASASFGGRSGVLRANETVGRAKSKRDSVSLECEMIENVFSAARTCVETVKAREH